jgi:hypothetical protein
MAMLLCVSASALRVGNVQKQQAMSYPQAYREGAQTHSSVPITHAISPPAVLLSLAYDFASVFAAPPCQVKI